PPRANGGRLRGHGRRGAGHVRGRRGDGTVAGPCPARSATRAHERRRRHAMSSTDATPTTTGIDPSDLVPLETACEWRSPDLGDRYVFQLTKAHVEELDDALRHAESVADDVLDITRESF